MLASLPSNMTLPNATTPCVILNEGGAKMECLYEDGIRIMQAYGARGVAATLMTVAMSEEYLLQTMAERPFFTLVPLDC